MKTDTSERRHPIDALAACGFGFTLSPYREKHPRELAWQKTPQTADVARRHRGNVGVLLGEVNGRLWASMDIDENWPGFLKTFPGLANTLHVWLDDAPDRGKIVVEIAGELPPNKAWGHQPGIHGGADLLANGKHAIVAGIHPSGTTYRNNGARPIVMTAAELLDIWHAWTVTYEEEQAPKAPKRSRTPRPAAVGDDEGIDALRRHWTALAVFEHFGKVGSTQEDGANLRILGHGGLLVGDPNGPEAWRWYSHVDQAGGDAFDAWAYCTGGHLPEDFVVVATEMAAAAGIVLPTHEERRAAVGDQIAAMRDVVHKTPLTDFLTYRTANGQYRTYASDLAAIDAALEIFGKYGRLYGPIGAAQIAEGAGMSLSSAQRTLERLCTGLLVRIETERPPNGAYTYQIAPILIDAGELVRKRVANTLRTKERYPFTHKAYSDHRADDAFGQSMTPITAAQVAERVAAGNLYAKNYSSVLERRLAAVVPSACRMVLVLIDEMITAGGSLTPKDLEDRRGLSRFSWHRAIGRAVELSIVEENGAELTLRADWEDWVAELASNMPTWGAQLRRGLADIARRERALDRATAGGKPPLWARRWQETIEHRRPLLEQAAQAYQARLATMVDRSEVVKLIDLHRAVSQLPTTPVDKALARLTPKGNVHLGGNRLSNRELPGYTAPEDLYADAELDILDDLAELRRQAYAAAA